MIYVFGDSYACPNYIMNKNDEYMWTKKLEKKFKVINFALSGTGPHYSFKKFYEMMSKKMFDSDDLIIFIISGNDRIDFKFENPQHITCIGWNQNKKIPYVDSNAQDSVKDYFNLLYSEISFYFMTNEKEIEMSVYKNIGLLFLLSKLLKIKTIVFYTSENLLYNFNSLNDEKFYIYDKSLSNISGEEIFDYNGESIFNDFRHNHLSKQNHIIFYENLLKILSNDYNNLSNFEKNIFSIDQFNHKTEHRKFIYE